MGIIPEYLAKCGGIYSSEWYWAKVLKCARTDSTVFAVAASWVELADWIPAVLTGTTALNQVKRCICTAGHKAMFNPAWGGYQAAEFLASFDNGVLARVRGTLPTIAVNISDTVGTLTLHSSPAEIFRALVEATAFGARIIRDRMREYGVPIDSVINCGGISKKSPMLMQIYADVLNCPMLVSSSEQTCALGVAMAGAVDDTAHSRHFTPFSC